MRDESQLAGGSWQLAELNFEYRMSNIESRRSRTQQLNNSRDPTDEGPGQRAAGSNLVDGSNCQMVESCEAQERRHGDKETRGAESRDFWRQMVKWSNCRMVEWSIGGGGEQGAKSIARRARSSWRLSGLLVKWWISQLGKRRAKGEAQSAKSSWQQAAVWSMGQFVNWSSGQFVDRWIRGVVNS